MGSRGAQKSPGKPPSLSKVGRVSGGGRKVDRIGKGTSLERWLLSGAGRQVTGAEADPDRRKGGNREEKESGSRESGSGSKEGIAGGGEEPACPGKEGDSVSIE